MEEYRINKYIALCGICSRREADTLIEAKRIKINGNLAEPGSKVTVNDEVTLDGKPVKPEEKKVVNRETVAKIREMFGANVLYLEYQPETEKYGGDIYRKWGKAVQHVETEYSQICTDKEFLSTCIHS